MRQERGGARRSRASEEASSRLRPNLRILVANPGQVSNAGLRPEIREGGIGPRLPSPAHHLGVPIAERAEDDRVRRARLLTRRLNLRAAEHAAIACGRDLRLANSL